MAFSGFGYRLLMVCFQGLPVKTLEISLSSSDFQRGIQIWPRYLNFFFLDFCRGLRCLFYSFGLRLHHGQFPTTSWLGLLLPYKSHCALLRVNNRKPSASKVGTVLEVVDSCRKVAPIGLLVGDDHLIYPIMLSRPRAPDGFWLIDDSLDHPAIDHSIFFG